MNGHITNLFDNILHKYSSATSLAEKGASRISWKA